MKNLKFILLIIVILSGVEMRQCYAQNYADKTYYLVDSLDLDELGESDKVLLESSLKEYHKAKDDTSKINALNSICESMVHRDWIKFQYYQHQLIVHFLKSNSNNLKIKKTLKKCLALAINNIGFINESEGNYLEALKYYEKSLKIKKELGDYFGIATSLNNMGIIKHNQGDIPTALEYFQESLKIREKINDKDGMSNSYNNIGIIHQSQGDRSLALEYFNKSLKILEEVGNKKGVATCYNNIGSIYQAENDTSLALTFYIKSLKIQKELNNKNGMSRSYNNIGLIYKNRLEFQMALNYYYKALELRESVFDRDGISSSVHNIGVLKLEMGELKEAKKNGKRGLKYAIEIGNTDLIERNAKLLSDVAMRENKYKEALKMYKLYIQMRDSINNETTQKATIQQQAKYEYEKQKAVDDAEHEKEIAIEQEAKEKQTILTYATGGGLGLVGIFLLIVFNRLKVTRKQKNIIEEQKQEVEKQKTVVELAHTELEEKNKEITDSIQYAKRIQSAILPPAKVVKEYLQESFIYYKPKDIVAGDFYWLESVPSSRHAELDSVSPKEEIAGQARNDDSVVLFAAADCTGHGVPGAMVSVVCNNGLNRSVREFGLTDPGEILNKTREIVVQEFAKSEEEVKDGMDIALCSLEGNTLQYAGAHNPLWIIRPVRHSAHDAESPNNQITGQARNDEYELIETKANKQPIGQFDNPEPYTTHTLELQKGDSLYIFSDGYADQFGGEKGKKLKTANLKKLLLSIQKESMEKQKQLIDEAFEDWKGNLEQLDDVCVIGVRI